MFLFGRGKISKSNAQEMRWLLYRTTQPADRRAREWRALPRPQPSAVEKL